MTEEIQMGKMELRYVDPDRLHPNPEQPREHFEKETLEELAQSIKTRGEIQPIIVREYKEGYQIVAGERRWRAAKMAHLGKVPVLVRTIPEEEVLLDSIIENLHRKDLGDTEVEKAVTALWDTGRWKSKAQLSRVLGKSDTFVGDHLRVAEIRKEEPLTREVSFATAKATVTLERPERETVLREAKERRLTMPEIQERVRDIKASKGRGVHAAIHREVIVQGQWVIDRIRTPAEQLISLNPEALDELSGQQKERMKTLLATLSKKLDTLLLRLSK